MNRELIEQQLSALPLAQYGWIETAELEFSERIRRVCEQECLMYGKTWACPPAVGTVEECRARCLSYPHALYLTTLTEVSEAARTVEACADENANIIYGQIIDEELKDAVRITVIATGFKVGASQSSMDFAPRKDLFASTEPAPQPVQQAPVTFSAPAPTSRFTDEDYIPAFLKRAR